MTGSHGDEQHPPVSLTSCDVSIAVHVVDKCHVAGIGSSQCPVAGLALTASVEGDPQLRPGTVMPYALGDGAYAVVTPRHKCAERCYPRVGRRDWEHPGWPAERLRPRRAFVVVDPGEQGPTRSTEWIGAG